MRGSCRILPPPSGRSVELHPISYIWLIYRISCNYLQSFFFFSFRIKQRSHAWNKDTNTEQWPAGLHNPADASCSYHKIVQQCLKLKFFFHALHNLNWSKMKEWKKGDADVLTKYLCWKGVHLWWMCELRSVLQLQRHTVSGFDHKALVWNNTQFCHIFWGYCPEHSSTLMFWRKPENDWIVLKYHDRFCWHYFDYWKKIIKDDLLEPAFFFKKKKLKCNSSAGVSH